MPSDPKISPVIRRAVVSTVKDGIKQHIYFQTDSASIVDFKDSIEPYIHNVLNENEDVANAIIEKINNQDFMNAYSKLKSPNFKENPTAPTKPVTDNSTSIATTAFVNEFYNNNVSSAIQSNFTNTNLLGVPTAPTANLGTRTNQIATTAFVQNQLDKNLEPYALKNSPMFTGTVRAPTPSTNSNDDTVATTAFISSKLLGKQDVLTFDTTPTSTSSNPVTSGGVYTAIKQVSDSLSTVAISGKYSDLKGTPTIANTATAGLTKVYDSFGNNSDGTVTQKAITNALSKKVNGSDLSELASSGNWNDLKGVPTATNSISGISKLYNSVNMNTDGGVTPSAVYRFVTDSYYTKSGGLINGDINIPSANKLYLDGETKKAYIDSIEYTGISRRATSDSEGNVINTTYATKAEVRSIPKFQIAVVTELPTENIESTTLYLLKDPSSTEEDSNHCLEYVYANGKWELVGSNKIDLSEYYKKSETDTLLDNKLNVSGGTVNNNLKVNYTGSNNTTLENMEATSVATAGKVRDYISEINIPYVTIKNNGFYNTTETSISDYPTITNANQVIISVSTGPVEYMDID